MINEPDSWLGLELRHLFALKAVAEEGAFGRAATRLAYTQSAVSQQIATLERIVGCRLVDRPGGPRPITITEAGRLLLRHADAITARLRAARADLVSLALGEGGPLRVGTYQSTGAKILPPVLRRFAERFPEVDVQLRESADDRELVALVEAGELDLTFVVLPVDPGPFETTELLHDPYVLVVPAGSPLAGRERPPALRELIQHPLISYRTCRNGQAVEERLRHAGREPHIVFRSDDNGTVQALVAAGVGIAIVPLLTVDESDPTIEVVALGDRVAPRTIGLATHRDRYHTQVGQAFAELALDVCARFGREGVGREPTAA